MTDRVRDTAEGAVRDGAGVAPAGPKHIVITVHGIRTYGNWQGDLKALLEEAEPGITVLNYQYGYFSALAFLLPPLRWLVARRFRRFFLQVVGSTPAGTTIDVVAHSFGTYLAATALPHLPQGRKVDVLIFAGSVLRPSFPWYRLQQSGRIGLVVNECGWDDSVLLLCQFTALMMGMAGRVGFQGMVSKQFLNRYHRFGHGGYFDPEHRFMRENWVPVLTRTASVLPIDARPKLSPWGGAKLTMLNNMQFIKVAVAVLLALAIILFPIDWWRKADFQRRVERFNHIARLANATQIPGRDPDHVRDLLHLDLQEDEDERTIDHLIGNEVAPEGDDGVDAALAEDARPRWLGWLPGLSSDLGTAYRARQFHALANYQLAAGKRGAPRDRSKAKLLYEDALRCYQQINDRDPAHGSYALCLIDYGLLLQDMGYHNKAIDQFRMVRERVFPKKDEKGQDVVIPTSLVVDTYCYEANSLKALQQWDDAEKILWEAVSAAGKDNALKSLAYNMQAWLKMERLDVSKARDYFGQAKEACDALVDGGQFIYRTRLYHIRHGLAMAQRLCGDPDGAYDQYDRIVKELQDLMRKDLEFGPKERRDLRDRLVNSMERRADVRFFARKSPTYFAAAGVTSDGYRDLLGKVERDYQEAIEQVANDDLEIKARLLYKKVIARCLAGMGPAPAARPEADDPPSPRPIDLEFAEAQRTYGTLSPELRKDLSLYQKIAGFGMDLHTPPGKEASLSVDGNARRTGEAIRYAPQAVAGLRALTIEYGAKCEKLDRDHIEMLLVALEILLEQGIEPDVRKNAQDATRMMAVLGATTRVAAHGELQAYVDRFNAIASRNLSAPSLRGQDPIIAQAPAPAPEPAPAPIATSDQKGGPRVLFFLRLSPSRVLMVAEDPDGRLLPDPTPQKLASAPEPGLVAGAPGGPSSAVPR